MLQAYKGSDKIAVYCYVYIACLSELALSHSDTTLYPEEAVIQTVSILNKSDYLKFYFRINI